MTDNVQRFASRFAADDNHYTNAQTQRFDFAPGESEPHRRSRRGVLRRVFLLLTVFTLGWMIYDDPTRVGRWWSTASELAKPMIGRMLDHAVATAPSPGAIEPAPSEDVAMASTTPVLKLATPYTQTAEPEKPPETVPAHSEVSKPEAPKIIATLPAVHGVVPAPSIKQKAPPKQDKYVVRARSVGLHPKLSSALLTQLSDTDFRHARYAIRTALSRTKDDATFKWPQRRKSGLAMFEVRFVTGAAKGCRRYVVTIEKDRWLTTALPIEKCGVMRKKVAKAAKS